MADDRRAFLKKVAKGTIYSVPVIRTLSTPLELAGVQQPSMVDMGGGMPGALVAPTPTLGGTSTAPWAKPPGG